MIGMLEQLAREGLSSNKEGDELIMDGENKGGNGGGGGGGGGWKLMLFRSGGGV